MIEPLRKISMRFAIPIDHKTKLDDDVLIFSEL